MAFSEDTSTNIDTYDVVQAFKNSQLCKVCESENARMNFSVLCCPPCKVFFRRNARMDLNTNQCIYDGHCDVTVKSRQICRYCRFKKCLSVGMQRELIRASHGPQNRLRVNNKQLATKNSLTNISGNRIIFSLGVIPTLNLLRNDRSLLTVEQWSLLSNVVNVYDAKSPVANVRNILSIQSSFPPKIRLKIAATNMMDIIGSQFVAVYSFVEVIPEFAAMPPSGQATLMERNILNTGGYSGVVIFREAEVCSSEVFQNGFLSKYGSQLTNEVTKVIGRTPMDLTLLKLLIPIVMFSTCSDVVIPVIKNVDRDNITREETGFLPNTKHLLKIQNIYVEIMFKYMIYRYGYDEATMRFAGIIKHFLDQSMCSKHANEVQAHAEMVETIVIESERLLISKDRIDQ
ncbi:unnamed protein product [Adineta steineri]|uniref:Nuclear receptor domain-containing protein n=1 Tax=Adineta steineri TaxID=433720 RepID=A0A819L233_9BILA|nr:unnamed protein product [Adineta steineri]